MPDKSEMQVIVAVGDAMWYAFHSAIVSPNKTYPANPIDRVESRQRAVAVITALREQGYEVHKTSK